MDPISTIKTNVPRLSNPDTVSAAATAIDTSYKRLWSDVYQLGTLACLRAGLLARNALYEGNAVAAIYRVLASGHPAAHGAATAGHLLSILAALLQDVPAAFAAEGYAHLVYEAVDESELIIPDTSELNALRAQPVFVTLALSTLLGRPSSCDRDPHVSVGYINDLISMDGVDYITSTAIQALMRDRPFRETLYQGLHSQDPHKLFKCLQLLKRCVGGGPGMLGGYSSIHHELSPPWSLQQLLQLGAEQPLVAACNSVARLVRQHSIERQLLGLLHTTLLDTLDLLCAAENGGIGAEADNSGGGSSKGAGGCSGGNASVDVARQAAAPAGDNAAGQQPAAGGAAAAAAATAAGSSSSSSSSSSSGSSEWPAALVAAHMGLVLEVARLVPFLITSLERMQPYACQPAAAAALEAAGAGGMAALVAVLAAGDPTDQLMLQHEVEGYKVIITLTQQSNQLALAALYAGAARTIYSALVTWASFMPAPGAAPGTEPQTPDSTDCQLNDLDLDPGVRHVHRSSSSSSSSSGLSKAAPFEQLAAGCVNPLVAGAAAAALRLLHTLLVAAAAAAAGDSASSSSNSSGSAGAGAQSAEAANCEAGPTSAAAATALASYDMPEDLAALLLELWHIQVLRQLAADCLAQLQKLGLLSAVGAAGDVAGTGLQQGQTGQAAADTAVQPASRAAAGGAGQQVLGLEQWGHEQGAADGSYELHDSSRLLAQLKV